MDTNRPIDRAVSHAGSQGKLAKALGVTRQRINQLVGGEQPSPQLARAIEQATGGAVTRAELRPDVFA